MDVKGESTIKPSHGFALLQELNIQRRTGNFCDCLIRLHVYSDRLFMAHKSVLAAFSPVLAALLPSHGSFLDLNSPQLTPQTMTSLLEFMYTGSLPPSNQEESVLYAALYLQMEQLQSALARDRRMTDKIPPNTQSNFTRDREMVERQSQVATQATQSCNMYSSVWPVESSPTFEEVPVICRNKRSLQSNGHNTNPKAGYSKNVSEMHKPIQSCQKNRLRISSLDSSQSEDEKSFSNHVLTQEDCGVVSCGSGHFQSSDSSCSNSDINEKAAITKIPTAEVNSTQSLKLYLEHQSREVSHVHKDQDCSITIHSISEDNGINTLNPERQQHLSGIATNHQACEPLLSDVWQGTDPHSEQRALLESKTVEPYEKASMKENPKSCVNIYQSHLGYSYLADSGDSDSDQEYVEKDSCLLNCQQSVDMAKTSNAARSKSYNQSKADLFQCSMCVRSFSQRGSLNRHIRSHLGVRPYSCPRCSMTFSRQYRVLEHMRIHLRNCEDPP